MSKEYVGLSVSNTGSNRIDVLKSLVSMLTNVLPIDKQLELRDRFEKDESPYSKSIRNPLNAFTECFKGFADIYDDKNKEHKKLLKDLVEKVDDGFNGFFSSVTMTLPTELFVDAIKKGKFDMARSLLDSGTDVSFKAIAEIDGGLDVIKKISNDKVNSKDEKEYLLIGMYCKDYETYSCIPSFRENSSVTDKEFLKLKERIDDDDRRKSAHPSLDGAMPSTGLGMAFMALGILIKGVSEASSSYTDNKEKEISKSHTFEIKNLHEIRDDITKTMNSTLFSPPSYR